MTRIVSREKLGKKARKALDAGRRATWTFSPVTRRVESRKFTIASEGPVPGMMIRAWGFRYLGFSMRAFPNTAKRLCENDFKAIIRIHHNAVNRHGDDEALRLAGSCVNGFD